MKPSKLTICGINSYVTPQTVDFKKLAEGNLFGIFGATGSGKSTILDCIVIALFGTSDRDNLSNIINVNVKDAYIYFEFELERDGENYTYLVTRNYKLRQSGLASGASLTNLTTNENLGDSTDVVNSKLDQMLGISKKEFLKCVALPQNEFDKFLLDTPAERKKSISKLFNLEQFGDGLNQKVKTRLEVLTTKQSTLLKQIEGFGELNEFTQKDLGLKIVDNENLINTLDNQIKTLSFEIKELDAKNNKTIELIASNKQLSDIKSRESYYLAMKIAIDDFVSNKENLLKLSKMREKIVELDKINANLKTASLELGLNTQDLEELEQELSELKKQKQLLDAKADMFKLSLEKKKVLINEIDEKKFAVKILKDKHSQKLDQLLNLTEHEDKVVKNIENTLSEISKIEIKISKNDNLLKIINDALLLGESKQFVEKLLQLKSEINPKHLKNAEGSELYFDVLNLLKSFDETLKLYKSEMDKSDNLLAELKVTNNNLNNYYNDLVKQQSKLNEDLTKINKKYTEYYSLKIQYSLDSTNLKSELENLKYEILENNNLVDLYEKQLLEFDNLEDCSMQIEELNSKIEHSENEKFDLNNIISKNNAKIKALEVEVKYLNNEIDDIKQQIPPGFDASNFGNDINESNYSDKVNDLQNYEKQKAYFETKVEQLTSELNNELIDSNMVEQKHKELENLIEKLNNTKVELGILKTNYENNIQELVKQNEVETELHMVNKELQLTQKLASYISKNALVDFVSEEYLYMISEYANKFVYSISRGKYMLKYSSKNSGEFLAIDNFNGGMTRGIKTLSGGERFIFSLSLALGVSQSISVSNNKSFNFFFIDEGFGNLSDDYIDDVLSCFDSLIKLDFTVGFITHVEKMEEYINNKVVVLKENNEEGSIIKQY